MTARHCTGDQLVVASHNQGKIREIRDLLAPFGIHIVSAADAGLSEPDEDGVSFAENAVIKALAASRSSGLPALSDDSGLVVPALGGEPGIYSARWAGPDKDFRLAMDKVEHELTGKPDRSAYFACALALAWPDDHVEVFEGQVHGHLEFPPRGEKGFGYDPIFVPQGYDITFGQMDPAKKHSMSHRARAFEKMVNACFAKETV